MLKGDVKLQLINCPVFFLCLIERTAHFSNVSRACGATWLTRAHHVMWPAYISDWVLWGQTCLYAIALPPPRMARPYYFWKWCRYHSTVSGGSRIHKWGARFSTMGARIEGSSAVGAGIRVPSGVGSGCPLFTGVWEWGIRIPRKFFWFWISKCRFPVHSGHYFVQLSCLLYTQKLLLGLENLLLHAQTAKGGKTSLLETKRDYSVVLCVIIKHCYWL